MDFDRQSFPITWEKMCAGSSIELGEHVWLSDGLLFYPDAVVTTESQPSWTLQVPLLFDLERIAAPYRLPCGRIDECLWMLVAMIVMGVDARAFAWDSHFGLSHEETPRLFAYIDEIPWGVTISARSSDAGKLETKPSEDFGWSL